ncbi:hypothetical protein MKW94_024759 [Papaver nudicaule]|uniref:Uncharacterized protein n=1 Tax=Papaver nudicaule TaxID=74823 RepID=A0AA41V7L3_PAPNU|nr:hypothetical protein [Papaver nudicaule]
MNFLSLSSFLATSTVPRFTTTTVVLHRHHLHCFSTTTRPSERESSNYGEFEGFGDESEEEDQSESDLITDFRSTSPPPILTQSDFKKDEQEQDVVESKPSSSNSASIDSPKPSSTASFEYWDEDEFEGLPVQEQKQQQQEDDDQVLKQNPNSDVAESVSESDSKTTTESKERVPFSFSRISPRDFIVEIICVSFLIMFAVNYFTGKKENENIALSWASRFATKDSIFDKNFSIRRNLADNVKLKILFWMCCGQSLIVDKTSEVGFKLRIIKWVTEKLDLTK